MSGHQDERMLSQSGLETGPVCINRHMIHTNRQKSGRMFVIRKPKHIALQSGDWGHTEWSQDAPGWDMRGSVWNVLQAYKKMLRVYWQDERIHVQQILAVMGGWYTAPKGRWCCAANLAEWSTWTVCSSARTKQVLRIPQAVCQDARRLTRKTPMARRNTGVYDRCNQMS
jgi:hypothetical protein